MTWGGHFILPFNHPLHGMNEHFFSIYLFSYFESIKYISSNFNLFYNWWRLNFYNCWSLKSSTNNSSNIFKFCWAFKLLRFLLGQSSKMTSQDGLLIFMQLPSQVATFKYKQLIVASSVKKHEAQVLQTRWYLGVCKTLQTCN